MLPCDSDRRFIPAAARHACVLLILAGTLLATSGCIWSRRPLFYYGPDGTELQRKRVARYNEVGRYPRFFKRLAYDKNDRQNVRPQSAEQAQILEEYGQPDYIRLPYRSIKGERVHEWAYLEKNKHFQFVDHTVVFDGALSDKDRILIEFGYPDSYLMQWDPIGQRRETFVYTSFQHLHRKYMSFANDKMVFAELAH